MQVLLGAVLRGIQIQSVPWNSRVGSVARDGHADAAKVK